jgi:hypothetical protein
MSPQVESATQIVAMGLAGSPDDAFRTIRFPQLLGGRGTGRTCAGAPADHRPSSKLCAASIRSNGTRWCGATPLRDYARESFAGSNAAHQKTCVSSRYFIDRNYPRCRTAGERRNHPVCDEEVSRPEPSGPQALSLCNGDLFSQGDTFQQPGRMCLGLAHAEVEIARGHDAALRLITHPQPPVAAAPEIAARYRLSPVPAPAGNSSPTPHPSPIGAANRPARHAAGDSSPDRCSPRARR